MDILPVDNTGKATRKATPGGVTGKGFIKGDPRINRTKPGPGRPRNWWREELSKYEPEAISAIVQVMKNARHPTARLRAALEILDRLHPKPISLAPGEDGAPIEIRVTYVNDWRAATPPDKRRVQIVPIDRKKEECGR